MAEQCVGCTDPQRTIASVESSDNLGLCTLHWNQWVMRYALGWSGLNDEPAPCSAHLIGWRDCQGDVWELGSDGMLHTPGTRPFDYEHVLKKWGPLTPIAESGDSR